MHKDEIKGKLKETEGRVQDAFGDLANSPVDNEEGKMKQTEGRVQQVVGKVKDAVHKAVD